jgi:hypothetical protein
MPKQIVARPLNAEPAASMNRASIRSVSVVRTGTAGM